MAEKKTNHPLNVEVLAIEWYEVRKSIIKRATSSGKIFQFNRQSTSFLTDGEVIFEDNHRRIIIEIKPCDCIVFKSKDGAFTGRFCYYIGNRHLPVFVTEHGLALAYDAKLFETLLAEFKNLVFLEKRKLLPQQVLSSTAFLSA